MLLQKLGISFADQDWRRPRRLPKSMARLPAIAARNPIHTIRVNESGPLNPIANVDNAPPTHQNGMSSSGSAASPFGRGDADPACRRLIAPVHIAFDLRVAERLLERLLDGVDALLADLVGLHATR